MEKVKALVDKIDSIVDAAAGIGEALDPGLAGLIGEAKTIADDVRKDVDAL